MENKSKLESSRDLDCPVLMFCQKSEESLLKLYNLLQRVFVLQYFEWMKMYMSMKHQLALLLGCPSANHQRLHLYSWHEGKLISGLV